MRGGFLFIIYTLSQLISTRPDMGNICTNLKCNDTKENNKCTHYSVKMNIISRKGQGAAGRTITEYQAGSKVFIITLDDMLHILRITTTVTLIYITTINHNFFMQDNKTGLYVRIIISIIIGKQIPNCNTVMKTKFFRYQVLPLLPYKQDSD